MSKTWLSSYLLVHRFRKAISILTWPNLKKSELSLLKFKSIKILGKILAPVS